MYVIQSSTEMWNLFSKLSSSQKGLMDNINADETPLLKYIIFSGLYGTLTCVLHFFHQSTTLSRVNMKCKY
jgi:hypothetical protein